MPWVQGPHSPIFGQVIGRQQVESAVLSTLQTWIGTAAAPGDYIGEIERQNGLPTRSIPVPPGAHSYHGGLDFDTWRQGDEPVIIANAQPVDNAEKRGDGEWSQWYEIRIAAICVADQKFYDSAAVNQVEDAARDLADLYGQAILGILTQQGAFATWIARTDLVSAPLTEFVNPEVPGVARSVCIVHSLVFPVVDESAGPLTPSGAPYTDPGVLPDAETTNLTFVTDPYGTAP